MSCAINFGGKSEILKIQISLILFVFVFLDSADK